MFGRATIWLLLLLGVAVGTESGRAADNVAGMLARSEARLGGLGGLGADASVPPKPPFAQSLVSPLNIATFLAGVGVAEGVNSQLFDDPMLLQEYFTSLGQPLTYIAFMIFDMSRYVISRSLYPLTSNPYNRSKLNFIDKTGGYIALAGASTVLHLLFEIIYSPNFKNLQAAKDRVAFEHSLNELWRENFLVADRWLARGLGTVTLLAAAVSQGYVAGLRLPLQEKVKRTLYQAIASRPLIIDDLLVRAAYDGRGLYVENIIATKGQLSQVDFAKYLHQPIALQKVAILLPRFSVKGKHLVFAGTAVGVLLHVLDMAMFIEFDHLYTALLEQPLWQLIHTQRITKLTAQIEQLCSSAAPDLETLRPKFKQLAQSWFDYRMLFIVKMLMSLRSWQDELQRQDRRFYQRLSWYRWLLDGGDYSDAYFQVNKHNWHAEPHTQQFQRHKAAMLKDMLHGFRRFDFFNYTFYGKTLAYNSFPAVIPPAARQNYPRSTLAILQRVQEERPTFRAYLDQWGRAYGKRFEARRQRFVDRYNAKARQQFHRIYLTEARGFGFRQRLPRSPFLAFDHEIDDLFALLRVVQQRGSSASFDTELSSLQDYYQTRSARRDESFLLDQAAQQKVRLQLALRWQQVRQQFATLPPATQELVQLLSKRIELAMIYRFAYMSLGSYLLAHNQLYLTQEGE